MVVSVLLFSTEDPKRAVKERCHAEEHCAQPSLSSARHMFSEHQEVDIIREYMIKIIRPNTNYAIGYNAKSGIEIELAADLRILLGMISIQVRDH